MGSDGFPLAFMALAFMVIGGVGSLVALGPTLRRQRQIKRRLTAVGRRRMPVQMRDTRTQKLARNGTGAGLDRTLLKVVPWREQLRLRLERTGRPITVGRYIALCGGIFVAIAMTADALLGLGPLASVLLGSAIGLGIPHLVVGRMAKKRVNAFMNLLPDAIELMVRALRSGLPISEAIINAGHEVADPVGVEFRQVENAMKLGRELEDVLWEMARRLDVPEFRFLVISMGIQRETGGNLADTLSTLGDMLRRRRQMQLKIKALSSEARSSALVLGLLPFGVTATMTFTSPDYIGRLFTDPRGLILAGIGIALMAIGSLVMAKIINFDI
ncbi:MAG TPA: type II secretion system F family protein [Alphaproteobacteria bacterium]|nr:type II secretion system F family protein [Alphaproteobacteria bacterium]